MSAVPASFNARFRAMSYADLQAVMAIEHSAYDFPWTENIIRDCIRVGYRCRILERRERVLAYGIMSVGAGEEGHILNLCVQPRLHGGGMGRQMLEHLLELAVGAGIETLLLEVRPSNVPAIRLYQSAGFCEVGLRPDYYPSAKGREDAVIMARAL